MASPAAEDEPVVQLRIWLAQSGAEGLDKLRVAPAAPEESKEERGILAREAIGPGQVIAKVPQTCVFSSEKAWEGTVGQACLAAFPKGEDGKSKVSNKMVFLLDVIAARTNKEHPLAAYAASLPSTAPSPVGWPPALRAMLQGTNLAAAVAEERSKLEDDFDALMPKLREANPELFCEKRYSLDMLLWAYGVWFSRRFPTALSSHTKSSGYRWQRSAEEEMEEESDGEGAMVPFMDFTNHRSGTKIVWSADDMHVTFTAGEPGVAEGTEVFNNYGDKSNEDLLLIHGFALLDNIFDTYGLWLSVQVSEEPPSQRPKKKRRAPPKTQRIGPFLLRRADARWDQFPAELWLALSSASGREAAATDEGATHLAVEPDHLRSLATLLQQRLQDFTATKGRDRHFASGGAAEGGDLDPRIRCLHLLGLS
ncbi:set10 [Symbiodinium pilosum]|uniref:Set10 protein n=1 Tax=Symbiodinium pilosum TaxID=2952 RepID=A0A812U9K4_SYMPI|nr:set10 [Symbiodinium pilosum]